MIYPVSRTLQHRSISPSPANFIHAFRSYLKGEQHNAHKSPGPDGMHPSLAREVRGESSRGPGHNLPGSYSFKSSYLGTGKLQILHPGSEMGGGINHVDYLGKIRIHSHWIYGLLRYPSMEVKGKLCPIIEEFCDKVNTRSQWGNAAEMVHIDLQKSLEKSHVIKIEGRGTNGAQTAWIENGLSDRNLHNSTRLFSG